MKVDQSKAYDRVCWDFLESILVAMIFPEVWVHRIMQCVSTVSYSVLVNGEPSASFMPNAGLRQGDPLSPYLFILCMEVLSKKLSNLQVKRKIADLKIARVSSLFLTCFFVDDAFFYFKAKSDSGRILRDCINSICGMSGEMINFEKSCVIFSPNNPSLFI